MSFYDLTQEATKSQPWYRVAESYFKDYSPAIHQIDSYNTFMLKKLPKIITKSTFEYSKDGKKYVVHFEDPYIEKPQFTETNGITRSIRPGDTRTRNLSYMCKIYAHIVSYELNNDDKIQDTQIFRQVYLGSIPCMVKSEYCNLYGKNKESLYKNKECPLDPGGYFIINGSEKVLMSQDRMAHNEIFVFKSRDKDTIKAQIPDSDKTVTLSCDWSAEVRSYSSLYEPNITTTYMRLTERRLERGEEELLYIELPGLKEPIEWMVVFLCYGITDVNEIISYVCNSDDIPMLNLLQPSLSSRFTTQKEALEYMSSFVISGQKEKKILECKKILQNKLFQNVQSVRMKCYYLGDMTCKLLETALKRRNEDDRDHYAKKRVETAGNLINNLFKSIWKRIIRETCNNLTKKRGSDLAQLFYGKITNYIKPPFATGNWVATKGNNKPAKVGISQLLNRHNYIATLSNLRRVITPSDKNSKIVKPRHLHCTHWYYICPAETPEGQTTGLVKNMAMLTIISKGTPEIVIIDWLRMYPDLATVIEDENEAEISGEKIFINGSWKAYTTKPVELLKIFRRMRQQGKIHYEVSISQIKEGIRIHTDEGRLLAPFFVVENGSIKSLPTNFTWSSLIDDCIIEYLDVSELETIKHSYYPWNCSKEDTHSLIHPCFMFGVSACTAPFPDHNQSPRNAYQCLWEEEPVLMGDGTKKKIKDIKIGDEVMTFNPNTFEIMKTNVINAYTKETDKKIVKIKTITGEKIVVTEDHKMMTNRGWVEARDLDLVKDSLAMYLRDHIIFAHIESVIRVKNVKISDITTAADTHSFIAGDGFCVHNSSMGKQALGVFASNYLHRYDTSTHILYYPQRPLVDTSVMNLLKSSEIPTGQNLIVWIMCGGYNQEDSVIINRRAIDNGALRSINYTTYTESNYRRGNSIDTIKKPEKITVKETRIKGYSKLDNDGISKENTPIAKRDVVIGKVNTTSVERDISIIVKTNGMEENSVIETEDSYIVNDGTAVIDRVIITLNEDNYKTVRVRVRQNRIPQIGDKVASRAAQKGIIGMILPPEDMPFSEQTGMSPDLIMNPNALPSRMTVAQVIECILGKACALNGAYGDATPFNPKYAQKIISKELKDYGFMEHGDETAVNGYTGDVMECTVFQGPTYYQRLKHMVDDKIHCLTPDHDVLTYRGWIPITSVQMTDKVATLQNGKTVYTQPLQIWNYDYSGDIYQIESQQVDLMVTPEHKMWVAKPVRRKKTWNYGFYKAGNIFRKHVKYKKSAIWPAEEYQFFLDDKKVDMNSWLILLGIWFTEGWIEYSSLKRVIISDNKQRVKDALYPALDNLNFNYYTDKKSNKTYIWETKLIEYLKTVSVCAINKTLPEWVWCLSCEQSKILLESMCLGNSSRTKNGTVCYYTSSLKLADDVQRLALHCGWSSNKCLWHKAGNTTEYQNQQIVSTVDHYKLSIIKTKNNPSVNHDHCLKQDKLINYTGTVHCLEVPGNIFYVRRNGKPVWTGNSRDQDGPRETLTRQPVEGRKRGGGFRMGEMETWCGISHGASSFLIDRLVNNSDGYEKYVCNYCGNTAIASLKTKRFECKRCEQNTAISKIRVPYAFKLLQQELMACCIGVWYNVDEQKTLLPANTPSH